MDNIRNTIILFCIILFFILLFYSYNNLFKGNADVRKKMQLIISPNKEPFTSISTENNTVADNDFNNNINNNNTVKEGGSYLNSWFKRSCSCAEGFENAYSNSNTVFDFYKYTKLSKNKNYQLNGFNDLQNIVVHTKTQMKMYYYNFQYKLKEYIDITDKIIFEQVKASLFVFG